MCSRSTLLSRILAHRSNRPEAATRIALSFVHLDALYLDWRTPLVAEHGFKRYVLNFCCSGFQIERLMLGVTFHGAMH